MNSFNFANLSGQIKAEQRIRPGTERGHAHQPFKTWPVIDTQCETKLICFSQPVGKLAKQTPGLLKKPKFFFIFEKGQFKINERKKGNLLKKSIVLEPLILHMRWVVYKLNTFLKTKNHLEGQKILSDSFLSSGQLEGIGFLEKREHGQGGNWGLGLQVSVDSW